MTGSAAAVLGLLLSFYSRRQAAAAVRVRPDLADVGFLDAALSGHFWDWFYYTSPVVATVVSVSLIAFFGFVAGVFEA